MAERQKQNAVQRKDPPQKQNLMDLHSNKSCKQSNNDLTPPTTDTRQMVRATASSPFDKPHLRTLTLKRDPIQKQNLMDLNNGHSLSTNSDETQQSMSLMKHQDADPPTKKLTASKDRTPTCCTDAASTQTVDSIQHATSET
jgi:hypothetical protein